MTLAQRILKLRRQRARLIQEAQHLLDDVEQEGRSLTTEERDEHDEYMQQIDDLAEDIRRLERQRELNQDINDRDNPLAGRPDPSDSEIGMSDRDVQRYSLLRAVRAAANHDWRGAELEREASEAVAERIGVEPQGFYVPYDFLRGTREQRRRAEERDLEVATDSAGGDLVATELEAASFIELLRNAMVLRQAGMTVLSGLQGDLAIPRQTGGATAYWVGEGNAPTESAQTVDQVPLTPHTVGAFTDYTRKLLLQSSIDVENFVRGDLAAVLGLAIDYAGLHGDSGSDANQPDGVAATSGIGTVEAGDPDGAAPDWGDIVSLETEVAVDNAAIGRLAYITNAKVRGKLKQTEKASNTAMFVWTSDQDAPLNGYPAHVTNQVRSDLAKGGGSNLSAIFFGNWRDLILALWSGLDILVDPYTGSTSGTVRVVALQDVDFGVRHAESFALLDDAVTT